MASKSAELVKRTAKGHSALTTGQYCYPQTQIEMNKGQTKMSLELFEDVTRFLLSRRPENKKKIPVITTIFQ